MNFTYETTITRAVGPTTLSGKRGTLPEPSPSDANVIHLATNGDDFTADGTAALPFDTYNGAQSGLTALKPTIYVFRNGAVGPLDFNEIIDFTLPANRNVQVEEGEQSKLTFADGKRFKSNSGCLINGIEIEGNYNSGSIEALIGGGGTLDNCYVTNNNTTNNAVRVTYLMELKYSVIVGIQTRVFTLTPARHCIFLGLNTDDGTPTTLFVMEAGIIGTYLVAKHCIFANCDNAISVTDAIPGIVDWEYEFLHCFNCDYAVASAPFVASIYTHEFKNSLIQTNVGITSGLGAVILTDPMPTNTTPMYVNAIAGLAGDQSGFRLQYKGKTSPSGGIYKITSPLVDVVSTEDLNPWEENTTGPVRTFDNNCNIISPADSLQLDPVFVGGVQDQNEQGDIDVNYIRLHWNISFNFGDGQHISNQEIWCLIHLLSDIGSKRLYPLGVGKTLFIDSDIGTLTTVSPTMKSMEPLGTAVGMIPNHWQNFWVIWRNAHFLIDSNDTTKLYLLNPFGIVWPGDGTEDFTIEYLMFQNPLNVMKIVQKLYKLFSGGGQWREFIGNYRRNYQYTINEIQLQSVIGLKANETSTIEL